MVCLFLYIFTVLGSVVLGFVVMLDLVFLFFWVLRANCCIVQSCCFYFLVFGPVSHLYVLWFSLCCRWVSMCLSCILLPLLAIFNICFLLVDLSSVAYRFLARLRGFAEFVFPLCMSLLWIKCSFNFPTSFLAPTLELLPRFSRGYVWGFWRIHFSLFRKGIDV